MSFKLQAVGAVFLVSLGFFLLSKHHKFEQGKVNGAQAEGPAPNSGLPGSVCKPSPFALQVPPVPEASTKSLGALPAYYEHYPSYGKSLKDRPRRIMMIIHGGGWSTVGAGAVERTRPEVLIWQKRGFMVVSTTYRGCGKSLKDVLAAYDRIRATYPKTPICASGASAGGHLTLMLALRRPELYCAISQGGPSSLDLLKEQSAYDPKTGGQQQLGPGWAYHLSVAAWGKRAIEKLSPAYYPKAFGKTRFLLATAKSDTLIPLSQDAIFRSMYEKVRPKGYVKTQILEVGPWPWVHGGVSSEANIAYRTAELRLVDPLFKGSPPQVLVP